MYVPFTSNRRDTASGFSCRIVVMKIDDDGDEEVTMATFTTTTVITTGPGGCPAPDESICECGRIKDVSKPIPSPRESVHAKKP